MGSEGGGSIWAKFSGNDLCLWLFFRFLLNAMRAPEVQELAQAALAKINR